MARLSQATDVVCSGAWGSGPAAAPGERKQGSGFFPHSTATIFPQPNVLNLSELPMLDPLVPLVSHHSLNPARWQPPRLTQPNRDNCLGYNVCLGRFSWSTPGCWRGTLPELDMKAPRSQAGNGAITIITVGAAGHQHQATSIILGTHSCQRALASRLPAEGPRLLLRYFRCVLTSIGHPAHLGVRCRAPHDGLGGLGFPVEKGIHLPPVRQGEGVGQWHYQARHNSNGADQANQEGNHTLFGEGTEHCAIQECQRYLNQTSLFHSDYGLPRGVLRVAHTPGACNGHAVSLMLGPWNKLQRASLSNVTRTPPQPPLRHLQFYMFLRLPR